jgi:hypothetical protein
MLDRIACGAISGEPQPDDIVRALDPLRHMRRSLTEEDNVQALGIVRAAGLQKDDAALGLKAGNSHQKASPVVSSTATYSQYEAESGATIWRGCTPYLVPRRRIGRCRPKRLSSWQTTRTGCPGLWRPQVAMGPRRRGHCLTKPAAAATCCGLIKTDTLISVISVLQEVSTHGRETQDLYGRM